MNRRTAAILLVLAIAQGPLSLVQPSPAAAQDETRGKWTVQITGGVLASTEPVAAASTVTLGINNETRLSTGSDNLDRLLDFIGLGSGYTLSLYRNPPVGDVQAECISVACVAVPTEPVFLLPGHRLEYELRGSSTRGGVTFTAIADERSLLVDVTIMAVSVVLRSSGCGAALGGSVLDLFLSDLRALSELLKYPAVKDLAPGLNDRNPVDLTIQYIALVTDPGFWLVTGNVFRQYGGIEALAECLASAAANPFVRALVIANAMLESADIGLWFGLWFSEQLINAQGGTLIVARYEPSASPTAQFEASATMVPVGTAIAFMDRSSNEPTSWSWDFGDGTTSQQQMPSKAYAAPGTYTVSLTVANHQGSDTETKADFARITPTSPPSTSQVPASPGGPPPLARIGVPSFVEVVTNDLRVRSLPEISQASVKFEPLLHAPQRAVALDGPVHANGYDWYLIDTLDLPDGKPFNPFYLTFGWVAAGSKDGSEPWIAPAEQACPAAPSTVSEIVDLSGAIGVACFGGESIVFEAELQPSFSNIDFGFSIEPSWFNPSAYVEFAVPGDPPFASRLLLPVFEPPINPDELTGLAGTLVRVTGIFDHPAARTCSIEPWDSGVRLDGPMGSIPCRETFVVTAIEPTS